MKNVNVNVDAKAEVSKFYVGTSITFDVSIDVTCENNQAAIEEGLRKLSELAIAIPELNLTETDGTVIQPTIHNWNNNDKLVVEEEDDEE
jgi:hypothetical protein